MLFSIMAPKACKQYKQIVERGNQRRVLNPPALGLKYMYYPLVYQVLEGKDITILITFNIP